MPIHVFVSFWSLLSLFIDAHKYRSTFASSILRVLILILTSLLLSRLHFNQKLCMRRFILYICTSVSAITPCHPCVVYLIHSVSVYFELHFFYSRFYHDFISAQVKQPWWVTTYFMVLTPYFLYHAQVLKAQHLHPK